MLCVSEPFLQDHIPFLKTPVYPLSCGHCTTILGFDFPKPCHCSNMGDSLPTSENTLWVCLPTHSRAVWIRESVEHSRYGTEEDKWFVHRTHRISAIWLSCVTYDYFCAPVTKLSILAKIVRPRMYKISTIWPLPKNLCWSCSTCVYLFKAIIRITSSLWWEFRFLNPTPGRQNQKLQRGLACESEILQCNRIYS